MTMYAEVEEARIFLYQLYCTQAKLQEANYIITGVLLEHSPTETHKAILRQKLCIILRTRKRILLQIKEVEQLILGMLME